MTIIELTNLSKWYGEVIGLNNMTAGIGTGITGLVGPNGAGKTTLMGLVTGQLRPSMGSIRVLDQPIWNNVRVLRRIGYCPEGDRFWPKLTGWQYVLALTRMAGAGIREAKLAAQRAIEQTRMVDAMHRAIKGYSKGMRQRIKIAQALAQEPELLVLDEPFTGADPVSRHDLTQLLCELASGGIHILVSSHVLHEVEKLTHQILMINRGRMVAQGDVQEVRRGLIDRPHTIRVCADQTRRIASVAAELNVVNGVRLTNDTVMIETSRPQVVYSRLCELMLAESVGIREMSAADDSLEAVFGYVVSQD